MCLRSFSPNLICPKSGYIEVYLAIGAVSLETDRDIS